MTVSQRPMVSVQLAKEVMKLTISICLFIVATCFAQAHAEEIDVKDWGSVEILRNETLTARLRYRPVAFAIARCWQS